MDKDKAPAKWPRDDTAGQYIALCGTLARVAGPATPAELARKVKGARRAKRGDVLRVLTALGQARSAGISRYKA